MERDQGGVEKARISLLDGFNLSMRRIMTLLRCQLFGVLALRRCDSATLRMTITKILPGPWKIIKTEGGYRINDVKGRALAYVYEKSDPALASTYLTPEEALEMAKVIARLSLHEAH